MFFTHFYPDHGKIVVWRGENTPADKIVAEFHAPCLTGLAMTELVNFTQNLLFEVAEERCYFYQHREAPLDKIKD